MPVFSGALFFDICVFMYAGDGRNSRFSNRLTIPAEWSETKLEAQTRDARDHLVQLIRRFDPAVLPPVQIHEYDPFRIDSIFPQLLRNEQHQTGFPAASHAGDDLDNIRGMIKTPYLFQIVFALEQFHWFPPEDIELSLVYAKPQVNAS